MRVESGSSMHLRLGGAGRDSERPQRYAANNKQFRAIHMRVWVARIKTLLSPKSCGFFTHRTEENIQRNRQRADFFQSAPDSISGTASVAQVAQLKTSAKV